MKWYKRKYSKWYRTSLLYHFLLEYGLWVNLIFNILYEWNNKVQIQINSSKHVLSTFFDLGVGYVQNWAIWSSMEMLLKNTSSAAHHSKANTWETNIRWEGKFTLFRKLATWEDCGLMSKDSLWSSEPSRRIARGRKGELAGALCWPAHSQCAANHFLGYMETCCHQGCYSLLWSGQT